MKTFEQICEEIAVLHLYDKFEDVPNPHPDVKISQDEIKIAAYQIYVDQLREATSGWSHLNFLSILAHHNALAKGFYDDGKGQNCAEKLMLIVSELAEACEADRSVKYSICGTLAQALDQGEDFVPAFEKHVKNTFEDEIGDVIIRCLELCGWKNIDIAWHIEQKMKYNATREKMHGKKY